MTLATLVDHGGEDVVLLGHATGFCKEVWRPVIDELRTSGCRSTIVAWDARGHGSSPPLETPASWWTFGEDVLRLLDQFDGRAVTGVGHSMSGAALVMAEVLQPGSFAGLVLIEPVILPPPFVRLPEFGLALGARKRRRSFTTRAEAAERFRGKEVFSRWHPSAFAGYLEGGLVERGGEVHLACDPDTEADVFVGSAESGAWARLDECRTPVRLVISDDPGGALDAAMVGLVDRFPRATTSFLGGQGHLVVMERPDLIATEILEHLDAVAES